MCVVNKQFGTHYSYVMSNAADMLDMSVVRGMKEVSGVYEMCMYLARGGVGGDGAEWIRGLGLGITTPVGTGGMLDLCLCLGCGCVWCRWGMGRRLGPGSRRVGWCYVCMNCESGFFV